MSSSPTISNNPSIPVSSDNNSEYFYPLCPKCFRLPFYKILEKEPENIEIKCSCNFNQKFSISEFLILSEKNKNKIPKCEKYSQHAGEKGTFFCVQCQMIICNECSKKHREWAFDHILLYLGVGLNSNCTMHEEKQIEYFCQKCLMHMCKECAMNHKHPNLTYVSDILDQRNYRDINNLYKEAEEYVHNYLPEVKEKMIVSLKKQILRIEKAFENNLKKNESILKFLKILNDSFINYKPNYFIYQNILQNCHLKFKKINKDIILEDTSNNNVNKVINYLNLALVKVCENSQLNLSLVKDFIIHDDQITQICILPNENFVSCSADKTIKVFNLHRGRCELVIEPQSIFQNYYGHTNTISYVSVLSANEIISSSFDNTIKIWRIEEENYFCKSTLEGHTSAVLKVIPISKNRIASCSMDTTIKI
ncbi:MAG: hypothetical protein MJ252_03580, partial [archaeon]|nr:hypothetical protein [archaeon]